MFILNPDPYSLPVYRIGPFRTADLSINHNLPDSCVFDHYLSERFNGKKYFYTENGRHAINIALSSLFLQPDDVITILTTTGNFYISGCVTKEIEKFCRWSREILPETKALFVNHEFGNPYRGLALLKQLGLPIIEDCAGAFFSQDEGCHTGAIGDFAIYSFPKMFPIQVGGLLVINNGRGHVRVNEPEQMLLRHIRNVMSRHITLKNEIIAKRMYNYHILSERFGSIGLLPRFDLTSDSVPGVFMFRTNGKRIDLPSLKKYYWDRGVQSSVFYGEEAFFIPVHQALTESDLDYFFEIMQSFIQTDKR
jgi:hypothetical protein